MQSAGPVQAEAKTEVSAAQTEAAAAKGDHSVLPSMTAQRLAQSVADLAAQTDDAHVHEQLLALHGVLVADTSSDSGGPGRPPLAGSGQNSTAERGAGVVADLVDWLQGRGIHAVVEVIGRPNADLASEVWQLGVTIAGDYRSVMLRLPLPPYGNSTIVPELTVLSTLEDTDVPAPEALWFDGGAENPFGRPFLVTSRLGGETAGDWCELPTDVRSRVAEQAIDVLAELHSVNLRAEGLAAVRAMPTANPVWLARLFSLIEPLPEAVTEALEWLIATPAPLLGLPVLIHSDFRAGNLRVADGNLSGVIRWGLATPGDRALDLASCFMPVRGDHGLDEWALMARYSDATGVEVDPAAWHWHRVLAYTRVIFYMVERARAFEAGRSQDIRLAAFSASLPMVVQRLADALAQARAL